MEGHGVQFLHQRVCIHKNTHVTQSWQRIARFVFDHYTHVSRHAVAVIWLLFLQFVVVGIILVVIVVVEGAPFVKVGSLPREDA